MSLRAWLAVGIWLGSLGPASGPLWGDEVTRSAPATSPATAAADDYELYKVFVDTLDQVQRNFVQDISRRELIEAAIEGMLSKLEDPYSSYISPEDISRFKTSVESRFGGIGIQVEIEGDQLKVLTPLRGTPAYRAGLLAGDRIVEIEGEPTEGISIDEAVRRLKGEAGTSVSIGIIHAGQGDIQRVTLEREVIEVETVLGDRRRADDSWDYMLDPDKKIGYIRITAFSRDTADDLTAAVESLVADGLRGLVLDLRFNPGGLLSSAIEISDLFIASGRIVSTEGRNSAERVWDARGEGSFEGFPLAILVNRYSASASEIVAACLQDHGRAIVVGERTWGKGSVQNVIELEGGRSALKLTTASYKRPSGHKIHRFPDDDEQDEWGVMPNDGYLVKLDPGEMRSLADQRRSRDILRPRQAADAGQALSSRQGAETPEPAPGASSAPGEEAPSEEAAPDSPPAEPKQEPAVEDTPPAQSEAPGEAPAEPTSPDESAAETPAEPEATEAPRPDAADSEPAEPTPGADPASDSAPASDAATEDAPAEGAPPASGAAEQPPAAPATKPTPEVPDRQLQKAIEYLLSQLDKKAG